MPTTKETKQIEALRRVINHPGAWAKLMADDERQAAIMDMPHLVDMFEDAIIASDNAEAEKAEAEEEADLFADLDPGEEEPVRGNFGMRMAAAKKKKAAVKRKKTKAAKKAEGEYTYQIVNYKTKTVGNVCNGIPRKAVSAHTIAYEELLDGKLYNRVMLGSNQSRVVKACR